MDFFLGQLLLVPYNFAPSGTAFCNGAILPIAQNTALFSLLGTQFGGDGIRSFALPNLQGNVPTGIGTGPGLPSVVMGQQGGEQTVTLLPPQIPAHTHIQQGTSVAPTGTSPSGTTFAQLEGRSLKLNYWVPPPTTAQLAPLSPGALQSVGNSQPHSNLMPSLTLNYVIVLQGIFPQRP